MLRPSVSTGSYESSDICKPWDPNESGVSSGVPKWHSRVVPLIVLLEGLVESGQKREYGLNQSSGISKTSVSQWKQL